MMDEVTYYRARVLTRLEDAGIALRNALDDLERAELGGFGSAFTSELNVARQHLANVRSDLGSIMGVYA
jgi:hypothetical protein